MFADPPLPLVLPFVDAAPELLSSPVASAFWAAGSRPHWPQRAVNPRQLPFPPRKGFYCNCCGWKQSLGIHDDILCGRKSSLRCTGDRFHIAGYRFLLRRDIQTLILTSTQHVHLWLGGKYHAQLLSLHSFYNQYSTYNSAAPSPRRLFRLLITPQQPTSHDTKSSCQKMLLYISTQSPTCICPNLGYAITISISIQARHA